MKRIKNMKAGKISFILILFFLSLSQLKAEDKITTVPLVNLENLEPSFENVDNEDKEIEKFNNRLIKQKNNQNKSLNYIGVNIMGLDKITAKTSEIKIKLGETKKFGLLEIKAIKCGKTKSNNYKSDVAYIQVKDLSITQNEKVFVFNGWTFSSSPSLQPIEHPVYDLWLIGCTNV
jgi:hypothetical protein|tara:strand:- start:90 stop:617 length:528 start_codon:yes stop_codon:yes gene_type:complete